MCNKYKKGNISNCYKHWNNRSGFCFPWLSDLPSGGIKCLTDVLLTRVLILFFIRREGREEHAVLWRGTQESYVGEIRMSKAVILSAWMLKPRGQGASAWMGGLDPMCRESTSTHATPPSSTHPPVSTFWDLTAARAWMPRETERSWSIWFLSSHGLLTKHIESSGADLINMALSVGLKLVFRTVCVRWVVRLHEEVFCPQVNLGTIG